ncbi:hypothetical protein OIE82_27290 [Streptomyces althioticus]|uniref:Uncharacterized protein n=1 Tax=Streptomyces althioticus TaxID=83380 RepID=A0ABZ1YBA5_9ACTN
MTDFDPTSPWGERSPWDVAQPEPQTPTAPEVPVTNPAVAANPAPNPFKIGFTLKAASGYDAEWLTPTVYGATAQETAERGKELLLAMRQVGLIDLTSQAAEYTRGQFKGGPKAAPAAPAAKPSFQNGQVQYGNQSPQPPFGGDDQGVTTCAHGNRKHFAKDNWEAMFCTEREKSAQCPPAFKNKKSGKYELRS